MTAATATHQVGHVKQLPYTPFRSMDRAVFVIAATARHRGAHFQQPLQTPNRSRDKGVFATEPSARYANGLQPQPLCKQKTENRNCESETNGGLPNSQTSQPIYTRLSGRFLLLLLTTFPVLHPTSWPRCTTCLVCGGSATEIDGSHSPQIGNGREGSPKWFQGIHRPNH